MKTEARAAMSVVWTASLLVAFSNCHEGNAGDPAEEAGILDASASDTSHVDVFAQRDASDAAPPSFEGRALLVLSDADMPASAFMDGKLELQGRTKSGAVDTLTILGLPLNVAPPRAPIFSAAVPVSNSVIGPPYVLGVSPNGRRAYVLPTRGQPPPGVTEVPNVFTGLPTEAIVRVVDLTDLHGPEHPIVQEIAVGRLAHTLSLSPNGKLLAINTDEPGRTILLREVVPDGEIGREVAALGVEVGGKPLRRTGRVEWHPSGRFLAHGLPFENEIHFYEVVQEGQHVELRPFGPPVKVGKFPDEGAFTPDGRFYLTTDLHWGDDVPGLFVDPPPGTITVVAFDAEGGHHRVAGRAPTDVSPEGIAISPDGRFVVTGNLTRSFCPWDDPRLIMGGSLDLLELDTATGQLTARQRIPIHGILPEGLVFDAAGNYVAATVFDHYDPRRRRGAVEIFRLVRGDEPRLLRTNVTVEVPPGPHTLALVK